MIIYGIYQLSVSDPHAGTMVSYHPSLSDAREAFNLAKLGNDKVTLYGIYCRRITPTKKGILKFLNCHTPDKDNG